MAARAADSKGKHMLDSLYGEMALSIVNMQSSSVRILTAITGLTLLITGFSLGLKFLTSRKPKVA